MFHDNIKKESLQIDLVVDLFKRFSDSLKLKAILLSYRVLYYLLVKVFTFNQRKLNKTNNKHHAYFMRKLHHYKEYPCVQMYFILKNVFRLLK